MASSLAIQLDDGRVVVGTPKPEDQGSLGGLALGDEIELSGSEFDTSGHAMSEDVLVDVEGHAMTLRLPSSGDAEALRKALAVGAVTATLVAAGAIAAMQGNPGTVAPPQSITMPARGPAPAADFQIRKEQAADKMLEVPAPIVQPADTTTERLDHIAPAAGAGSGAGTVPQTITAPARGPAPAEDFQTRKEQQADEMLGAPQPLVEPSDVSTN
jgi:hypothetical protein